MKPQRAGRTVGHHTLYQVSTATALVQGVYQGAVRPPGAANSTFLFQIQLVRPK